MKKISVLMAAFMAVCMSALADDGIKVSPLTIAQGETADLEIVFESAEAKYVGYQFDVTAVGVGFNIDLDEEEGYDGGSALAKSHTIAASEPTSGTYRFLCSSNKNATIKAGSNVLMTISLKADATLEPGTYKVTTSVIKYDTISYIEIADKDLLHSHVYRSVNDEEISDEDEVSRIYYHTADHESYPLFYQSAHFDGAIIKMGYWYINSKYVTPIK